MGMSYRRAWELVEELNRQFTEPLVSARTGGKHGGGTALTPMGQSVVAQYHSIIQAAARAASEHLAALEAELSPLAEDHLTEDEATAAG